MFSFLFPLPPYSSATLYFFISISFPSLSSVCLCVFSQKWLRLGDVLVGSVGLTMESGEAGGRMVLCVFVDYVMGKELKKKKRRRGSEKQKSLFFFAQHAPCSL